MTNEDGLNPAAEEHHMGSLLLSMTHRPHLVDALRDLHPEDLYDPHLAEMWRSAGVVSARGQYVSPRTILAEMDTPAIRVRLSQYSAQPVRINRLSADVTTIRNAAKLRRLVQVGQRIIQRALEAEDYSSAHEGAVTAMAELDGAETPLEVVPFTKLADDWWAEMGSDHAKRRALIPSPWPELDHVLTGGFRSGRCYVVAARPGAGKSIVGLNVAAHAAELGNTALVFSAEMGVHEVTSRLMAAGGHADYGQIVKYEMDAYNESQVREYHEQNRTMPLSIVDNPHMSVEYISAIARTHKRTHDLRIVVVDYLQLLNASDTRVIREQQVAHISKTLKQLSRELDITVVEIAQLNRQSAKDNRRPTSADLRESGALEQDADVVLLLHHELVDDMPTGDVDVIVAKNRTGPTGVVTLKWRGYQARIGG